MAKQKSHKIEWPFAPLTKVMAESGAYKELSNAARVAYQLLQLQMKYRDQKEVVFPYSHAEPYMNRHTFSRAIKQLIEKGFIEKSQYGGLYRRTNVYRFIERWRTYKKGHTPWHTL